MRAVVTRVSEASVEIEKKIVGKIGKGFLVLLGVGVGDTEENAKHLAEKIQATLNEMNQAVEDISKSIETTGNISEQQAASTREITDNLSRVSRAAEDLKQYIQNLK